MKEVKLNEIKKVCWKETESTSIKCVIGFLINETDSTIHIAATKNIDGFSDKYEINKKTVVSITDVKTTDVE
jgi:hypothetical protein